MFSTNQLDPIASSEVMELLGSAHYDLNNPKKLTQIKDIVDYFSNSDNRRYQILKVLSGKSGDKLDILWTYVALQREKTAKTKTLNPELFEADVAAEISKGYLTQDKRNRIQDDLAKLKQERAKKERDEARFESEKDKAISKLDIETVEETLNDLSFIDNQLSAYE